jgi:hypothetical protein
MTTKYVSWLIQQASDNFNGEGELKLKTKLN